MTSGRFTPAAATRISTSPAPGCGTGRSTGCSTSGPPASAGSMAIILRGSVLIAPRSAPNCRVRKPPSVDRAAAWVDSRRMDLEELFPSKPGDPLVQLVKQDLDPLSVEELEERIA